MCAQSALNYEKTPSIKNIWCMRSELENWLSVLRMVDSGLQNTERGGEERGRIAQQRPDVRIERDFQNASVP